MTRLRIGILIACYNYERYVAAAINSALAQTRPADEIIVVDDGSSDRSGVIIASYEGRGVRVIQQANAGQTAAIRAGYAASSADVLQFLDADDRLMPDALAEIERVWTAESVKAQFELEIIDRDGRRLGRQFCHYPPAYDATAVASNFARTGTYIWPVTSGNAYARRLLDAAIDGPVPVSLDGVLNTVAPLYGEVQTVTKSLGEYRMHGGNHSHGGERRGIARPDFSHRIKLRQQEVSLLVQHGAATSRPVPTADPLDHEIAFVNYRLMARRRDEARAAQAGEAGVARLWWTGVRLALDRRGSGYAHRLAHVAWFSLVALLPSRLVDDLIDLRFGRAKIMSAIRARLSWR